jgi:uncharacterized phosphosugar-binding protein
VADWAYDKADKVLGGCNLLSYFPMDIRVVAEALRQARADALEEAAKAVEDAAASLDHPSVYMGGASHSSKRKAKYLADCIRYLKEKQP